MIRGKEDERRDGYRYVSGLERREHQGSGHEGRREDHEGLRRPHRFVQMRSLMTPTQMGISDGEDALSTDGEADKGGRVGIPVEDDRQVGGHQRQARSRSRGWGASARASCGRSSSPR